MITSIESSSSQHMLCLLEEMAHHSTPGGLMLTCLSWPYVLLQPLATSL